MTPEPAARRRRFGVRSLSRFGIGSETVKDSAYGLVNQGVSLVATFVSFALLSRGLGPTDYGSFASMYGLIGISLALAYAGPGLAFLQHGMEEGLRKISSNFFALQAALMLVAALLVVALAPWLLPRLPLTTVILFTIAEVFGVALVQLGSTLRLIADGFAASVPVQLIPVFIKLVAVAVLHFTNSLTLASYGLVYAVACSVAGVGAFLVITERLGLPRRFGRIRRDHLSTTATISSTIWIYNLHNSGDQLTMSANNLGADVGFYAAAYRLINFATVPVNALADSSHRSFVDPEVGDQFNRAVKWTKATMLYTAVVAVGLFFTVPFLLPILAGDGFDGAITIVRWLTPLMLIRAMYHFPSNALAGLGYPGVRLKCIMVTATIAMVLYIALIPHWSWKGALVGSYVSDTLLAIAIWFMLYRLRNRPRALSKPQVIDLEEDLPPT